MRKSLLFGLSALTFATSATATVFKKFDWNDGTVQGWWSNAPTANENSQLRFTRDVAGTLQIRAAGDSDGSFFEDEDWRGIQTISFDIELNRLDGNESPSDMSHAEFTILNERSPVTAVDVAELTWTLDVADWSFNEKRTFNLSVEDAVVWSSNGSSLNRDDVLAAVNSYEITFDGVAIHNGTGTGLLDNFVVAIPEVNSSPYFGLTMLSLAACRLRRTRPQKQR